MSRIGRFYLTLGLIAVGLPCRVVQGAIADGSGPGPNAGVSQLTGIKRDDVLATACDPVMALIHLLSDEISASKFGVNQSRQDFMAETAVVAPARQG
ncbi:MAG: hypothetical protein QOG67_911 [Verrucomicrobiota bacterium]|jgi:hypothetical protein